MDRFSSHHYIIAIYSNIANGFGRKRGWKVPALSSAHYLANPNNNSTRKGGSPQREAVGVVSKFRGELT